MRLWLLVLFLAGCAERALPLPSDAGPPDLSRGLDLAQPDLKAPHYCDGVYVIDRDGALLFFDPATPSFTAIAQISCPDPDGTLPHSMALGRDGTAWVVYDSGNLFRVDSETGSCSATSFVPHQQGFDAFGMGFASDAQGSTSETLFIDSDADLLGRIDLQTLKVSTLAVLPLGETAELTGTGAGDLWGFFRAVHAHLGHIDKTTGDISPDIDLSSLGDVSQDGFAIGFFGGAFYAFLDDSETEVFRIDPQTGASTNVLQSPGLHVVGAGVSTCAPTQ